MSVILNANYILLKSNRKRTDSRILALNVNAQLNTRHRECLNMHTLLRKSRKKNNTIHNPKMYSQMVHEQMNWGVYQIDHVDKLLRIKQKKREKRSTINPAGHYKANIYSFIGKNVYWFINKTARMRQYITAGLLIY